MLCWKSLSVQSKAFSRAGDIIWIDYKLASKTYLITLEKAIRAKLIGILETENLNDEIDTKINMIKT